MEIVYYCKGPKRSILDNNVYDFNKGVFQKSSRFRYFDLPSVSIDRIRQSVAKKHRD